ncbi:hypothetical protein EST38_g14316, partial [Candolleomyces aberdarensis]
AYISTDILGALLQIADSAFKEHLHCVSKFLGTESDDFATAHCKYNLQVSENFAGYLAKYKQQLSSKPGAKYEEAQVIASAIDKLKVILTTSFEHSEAPTIDSPIPLFSPLAFGVLMDDWYSVKDMVYVISSWYTPGLAYLAYLMNHSRSPQKLPFLSIPSCIQNSLEYWLGFETNADWSTPSVDLTEKVLSDGVKGSATINAAFNKIVAVLWLYRESVLRPATASLPKLMTAVPTEDASFPLEECLKFLDEWICHLQLQGSTQKQDVSQRLGPDLPDFLYEKIETIDRSKKFSAIMPLFEALKCCPLNFMNGHTGPTNRKQYQSQLLRHAWAEIRFYDEKLIPVVKSLPPVSDLYSEVVKATRSFPNLAHTRFWPKIPYSDDAPREIRPDAYHKQLVRQDRTSRFEIVCSEVRRLVDRIGEPDCLGVPVGQSHKLHRALVSALDAFVEDAAVVVHHLSLISHCSEYSERPVFDPEWNKNQSDSWVQPLTCRPEDLQAHYQEEEVLDARRASKVPLSNEKIDRDALDRNFGLHVGGEDLEQRSADGREEGRRQGDVDEPKARPRVQIGSNRKRRCAAGDEGDEGRDGEMPMKRPRNEDAFMTALGLLMGQSSRLSRTS